MQPVRGAAQDGRTTRPFFFSRRRRPRRRRLRRSRFASLAQSVSGTGVYWTTSSSKTRIPQKVKRAAPTYSKQEAELPSQRTHRSIPFFCPGKGRRNRPACPALGKATSREAAAEAPVHVETHGMESPRRACVRAPTAWLSDPINGWGSCSRRKEAEADVVDSTGR
jgi:hypothetical protein